jgi:hypothetical protein
MKIHILRIVVYAALAIYLLLGAFGYNERGLSYKYPLVGYVGAFLLLSISAAMLVLMWASYVTRIPRKYSHQIHEEIHKDFIGAANSTLASKNIEPLSLGDDCKLHILGNMHYDYFNFNLICGLEYMGKIIPFHLDNPLIISYLGKVPVISICVHKIGFDLLKITRHRDCCPYYDSNIFKDPDSHGYKFSSFAEYEDVFAKIEKLIPELFLKAQFEDAPLAYCVEVCRLEVERVHMQEYNELTGRYDERYPSGTQVFYNSMYRDLDMLAGGVENAKSEIKDRFARYVNDISIRRNAKSILKYPKKETEVYGHSVARIVINNIDRNKLDDIKAKKWVAENGSKITSAEIMLYYYRESLRNRGNFGFPHIKRLLLNGSKVPMEVISLKNKYKNIAINEAKLLENKLLI